jgi:hypothetical protein
MFTKKKHPNLSALRAAAREEASDETTSVTRRARRPR